MSNLTIGKSIKPQILAEKTHIFKNFKDIIGLSSRRKEMYQSYNSFGNIHSYHTEVTGAFFHRSDKQGIYKC